MDTIATITTTTLTRTNGDDHETVTIETGPHGITETYTVVETKHRPADPKYVARRVKALTALGYTVEA